MICAEYFQHKNRKFMQCATKPGSIFVEHEIIESFERVEFQQRGSPHEHKMLWLKNAPLFDPGNIRESTKICIEFIDRFITCEYDSGNPFMKYQMHRHTHTCKRKKRKGCRFNIPLPMMKETGILCPLDKVEQFELGETGKKHLEKINELMQSLYKKPRQLTHAEMLNELDLTEEEYIIAVRSSIKAPKVFLKRGSLEVGINAYNKDILCLFESNMDIQFILDEYALAAYMVAYITKIDGSLSKLLRQAAQEVDEGNHAIFQKFRKISNVFINSKLLSAQEAVYLNLSMALSEFSCKVIYLMTGPIMERVRLKKGKAEVEQLDPDDTNIFYLDIFEKYAQREGLEGVCLADFACIKNQKKDPKTGKITYTDREKPKILSYKRYSIDRDIANYFRTQCLLFLPWKNEEQEIEHQNCVNLYNQNKEIIENNRQKYCKISDELLEKILQEVENENQSQTSEENQIEQENPEDFQVDIFEQEARIIRDDKD